MARIVDKVLVIYNEEGDIGQTIPLNVTGISVLRLSYYLSYYNKDINRFIINILLSKKIFDEYDLSNICNNEDVVAYRKLVNDSYNYIFRNNRNLILNTLIQMSKFHFQDEYVVSNFEKVSELNYQMMDFYYDDEYHLKRISSYPLIPEFLEMLYKDLLSDKNLNSLIPKCITADIFIDTLNTRCNLTDKDFELIDKIDDFVIVTKTKYIKDDEQSSKAYNSFKNKISISTYTDYNIFNNVDLYADYLLNKEIEEQNVSFFEELRIIINNANTDEPDYNNLCDSFAKLLQKNNLNTELLFFKNIISLSDKETFILSFITNYFSVCYSKKFIENIEKKDSSGRTRE